MYEHEKFCEDCADYGKKTDRCKLCAAVPVLYEVGDVIQVTTVPGWEGCLMIVKEVKSFGVVAGMNAPMHIVTFLRLAFGQFVRIGKARYIPEDFIDD